MSMTKSDFNKILRGYDQKQAKNKQLQKKRQAEAFKLVPKLEDIHKRKISICLG